MPEPSQQWVSTRYWTPISWGDWEGTGNNRMRVGMRVEVEDKVGHNDPTCSFTVEYYTENSGTLSTADPQTLVLSGDIALSMNFTNNGGTSAILRTTRTTGYSYGGNEFGPTGKSMTFGAKITNHNQGATPNKNIYPNVPAREYGNPAAPTSPSASYVSDSTISVSWVNNSTNAEPVHNNYVNRQIENVQGFVNVAWLGATTAFNDTTMQSNMKAQYQIQSSNYDRDGGYVYTNWVWTSPGAPSAPTMVESGNDLVIGWTNNCRYAERVFEIHHCANGVWSYVGDVAGTATSWTHAGANFGAQKAIRHQYAVRAKATANGLTSAYIYTSTTSGTVTSPNAPTNLVPKDSIILDNEIPITFTWTHNPTDTTPQTKYELQYREVGAGSWTVETAVSSAGSSHTVIPFKFAKSKTYEWQVRTWGSYTVAGPWSTSALFKTVAAVPVKYPVYLDVATGRFEADSNSTLAPGVRPSGVIREFLTAATSWTATHGLEQHIVSVTLKNTTGEMFMAGIVYVDENTVRAEFTNPVAGYMLIQK